MKVDPGRVLVKVRVVLLCSVCELCNLFGEMIAMRVG